MIDNYRKKQAPSLIVKVAPLISLGLSKKVEESYPRKAARTCDSGSIEFLAKQEVATLWLQNGCYDVTRKAARTCGSAFI